MNIPVEQKASAKLRQAIRTLASGPDCASFDVLMGWIAKERDARDAENREIGKENTTSEAHALSVILKQVAACLAPVANRDDEESGAEGPSAGSIM